MYRLECVESNLPIASPPPDIWGALTTEHGKEFSADARGCARRIFSTLRRVRFWHLADLSHVWFPPPALTWKRTLCAQTP